MVILMPILTLLWTDDGDEDVSDVSDAYYDDDDGGGQRQDGLMDDDDVNVLAAMYSAVPLTSVPTKVYSCATEWETTNLCNELNMLNLVYHHRC